MSPHITDGFPTLAEGSGFSQSIQRGLAILGCYDPDSPVLGIADMADELDMSRSTVHRYAITLVALGFLEQTAARKYRLGPRARDLGMLAVNTRGLRTIGRPALRELRDKVSYTVSLGVLDKNELRFVDRLHGYRGHVRLGLTLGVGSRLPPHCTSMGKVLLAHLPDLQRDETIGGLALNKCGPNTITKQTIFLRELEQVAAAGFAINDEELALGARSIAAPVRCVTGEVVAAVNIAAPTSMVSRSELIKDFGPHLLVATEQISPDFDEWSGEW